MIDLAFPSARRLQAALRKEWINASLADIKSITSSGGRQVLQPPPVYKGNVTSNRIDDRWAADLLRFESRPATRDKIYRHVLLVQDIFSRYLWAAPLPSKTWTRSAFEGTFDQRRKPRGSTPTTPANLRRTGSSRCWRAVPSNTGSK